MRAGQGPWGPGKCPLPCPGPLRPSRGPGRLCQHGQRGLCHGQGAPGAWLCTPVSSSPSPASGWVDAARPAAWTPGPPAQEQQCGRGWDRAAWSPAPVSPRAQRPGQQRGVTSWQSRLCFPAQRRSRVTAQGQSPEKPLCSFCLIKKERRASKGGPGPTSSLDAGPGPHGLTGTAAGDRGSGKMGLKAAVSTPLPFRPSDPGGLRWPWERAPGLVEDEDEDKDVPPCWPGCRLSGTGGARPLPSWAAPTSPTTAQLSALGHGGLATETLTQGLHRPTFSHRLSPGRPSPPACDCRLPQPVPGPEGRLGVPFADHGRGWGAPFLRDQTAPASETRQEPQGR